MARGHHRESAGPSQRALRAGAQGRLPRSGVGQIVPDQVGSAWTRTAQVDVVGINRMDKTLVLGECKWGRRACDQEVLEKLASQAAEFSQHRH